MFLFFVILTCPPFALVLYVFAKDLQIRTNQESRDRKLTKNLPIVNNAQSIYVIIRGIFGSRFIKLIFSKSHI